MLFVPSEYATPMAEVEASRIVIKLRRSSNKFRPIELKIENVFNKDGKTSPNCGSMVSINNPLTVVIDDRLFPVGCDDEDDSSLIVRFSNEVFKELKDNAEINIGFGQEISDRQRTMIGLLDKNSLPPQEKNH